MCGICGIAGNLVPDSREAHLRRMLAALHHRGPDDEGLLVSPNATLGIRRLSIIDLPGGHQPAWNESGTVAVVFNGEIYNFKPLREELRASGHRFVSFGDTEVLVHGWEEWGTELMDRLRGMFAFAVAELPRGKTGGLRHLFLARDRLGIKPLYYAGLPGAFCFASEVRALLASGCISPELSHSSLESYLYFGGVSEPETLVHGVRSLPPGHALEVSVNESGFASAAEPFSWWDFAPSSFAARTKPQARSQPPARRLRELLEESVQEHLIADVPIGVFLSSGLDSTAIAALAARHRPNLRTYTVAFTERNFSEAQAARHTADHLGTTHSERMVTGEEMVSHLPESIGAMDQPTMDGVNTWFAAEAARTAGLNVALSGLGSDELFGGYSTFRSVPRLARLRRIGGAFSARRKATLSQTAERWPWPSRRDAARKALAAFAGVGCLPDTYFYSRLLFNPARVRALFQSSIQLSSFGLWRSQMQEAVRETAACDEPARISWLELRSYLPNILLRDSDAMSMDHSLEVRVPFLDHRLVEFALGCPEARRAAKALLAAAVRDILPAEMAGRRKKTFTLPWEQWLRGPLRSRIAASFDEPGAALEPVLDFAAVRSVWRDFLSRRTSWSRPWSLFVLNEWSRQHLGTGA